MAEAALALTALSWDSAFFGLKVARVEGTAPETAALGRVLELARSAHIDCLYYLLEADAHVETLAAQSAGFRLVDLRTTLEASPAEPVAPASTDVRLARASDVVALSAIARAGHRDSRFYCDGRFPHDKCDELYAVWIERSVQGALADTVLTIEEGGVAAGYVTCSRQPDGSGSIGLFGVAERARGRGLGQRLLAGALHWFAGQGAPRVSVVTQGRNAAAQRAYQRQGFVTRRVQLWYHLWLGADGSIL